MPIVDGHLLQAPINPAVVASLLGVGRHRGQWIVGYLCSNAHGKTNIFSKFKPVRFDKIGDLTRKRIGGVPSNFETAHFGLVLPQLTVGGQAHSYNFGYEPPIPGVHPCRNDDWVGYDHTAKPSDYVVSYHPSAVVGFNVGKENGLYFEFETYYRSTTSQTADEMKTGVDLNWVINNHPTISGAVVDQYPCVVVSPVGAPPVTSYMHALLDYDTGQPQRLGYHSSNGSGGVRKKWYLPLDNMPTGIQYPNYDYRVTVWLIDTLDISSGQPSGGTVSVANVWHDVTNVSLRGFAMPEGIGIKVTFESPNIVDFDTVGYPSTNETGHEGKVSFQLQGRFTSQADPNMTYYVKPTQVIYYQTSNPSNRQETAIDNSHGLSQIVSGGSPSHPQTAWIYTNLKLSNVSGYTFEISYGVSTSSTGVPLNGGTYSITKIV